MGYIGHQSPSHFLVSHNPKRMPSEIGALIAALTASAPLHDEEESAREFAVGSVAHVCGWAIQDNPLHCV